MSSRTTRARGSSSAWFQKECKCRDPGGYEDAKGNRLSPAEVAEAQRNGTLAQYDLCGSRRQRL
jgi:hypothetical protein